MVEGASHQRISDLIPSVADYGIREQSPDGSMPSGCNGPWRDSVTPVRNTAHWNITFLEAYNETADESYYESAKLCTNYLLSDVARPNGTVWHHRNSSMSKTNGLIGQAWTIESLCRSTKAGVDDRASETVREAIDAHPFNERLGAWEYVDLNGDSQGVMFTLNQQIWFTAMVKRASNLVTGIDFDNEVEVFLDNLEDLLVNANTGGFQHTMSFPNNVVKLLEYIKENVRQQRVPQSILRKFRHREKIFAKERRIGYHTFCLTGLAILAEQCPSHDIWKSDVIRNGLEYATSNTYYMAVQNNKYGFQYNVPGLEIPYIFRVFSEINGEDIPKGLESKWISTQFEKHYDTTRNILGLNTVDPETLSARMYESTRISNYESPV